MERKKGDKEERERERGVGGKVKGDQERVRKKEGEWKEEREKVYRIL